MILDPVTFQYKDQRTSGSPYLMAGDTAVHLRAVITLQKKVCIEKFHGQYKPHLTYIFVSIFQWKVNLLDGPKCGRVEGTANKDEEHISA